MKQRTPMKRTSFKPRQPQPLAFEQHSSPPATSPWPPAMRRQSTYAVISTEVQAQPKREYVRSSALMKAYRLIPCQHCGRDDGTVCGAHANWSCFGKGGHIKADDNRAASLCAVCHVPILDQGSRLTKDERKAMFWAAHVKTVHLLTHHGLWPASVPIPDTSINPL